MTANVFLLGAGPGDPGLITIKAAQCLQSCDVIIYDYLASPALLSIATENAELLYVGKKGGDHTMKQDQINQLIVDKAREGKSVCRLKGGDPYIFGRGGEEAEFLKSHHVPFEIVPGITSGIAAPAYAGIPLTHRKMTSTLAFVTGHEDPSKTQSSIHWPSLAKGIGTLVFYMGVKQLPGIVEQLLNHGKSPETPVALIRWGTTYRQQTVTGCLNTIVDIVKAAKLKAPAIIVVGDVVQLRDQLNWFEQKPLFGKTIVVTRARQQASDLVQQLNKLGAECIECPTIKIVPPDNKFPMCDAIEHISDYDWLVFTSVNGVLSFFECLFEMGKDVRILGHLKLCTIGPVTARQLMTYGIKTDILPKTYQAESVVEAFEKESMAGKKVLLPRAKEARSVLPESLRKMGAVVDEITAYQTIAVVDHHGDLMEKIQKAEIDMVTFTSSSTVINFCDLFPDTIHSDIFKNKVSIASIGPITSETAKEKGLNVSVEAEAFTIQGLVKAISEHYSGMNSE
jgi:uroporphyrinogen III methyltransferase/synthase